MGFYLSQRLGLPSHTLLPVTRHRPPLQRPTKHLASAGQVLSATMATTTKAPAALSHLMRALEDQRRTSALARLHWGVRHTPFLTLATNYLADSCLECHLQVGKRPCGYRLRYLVAPVNALRADLRMRRAVRRPSPPPWRRPARRRRRPPAAGGRRRPATQDSRRQLPVRPVTRRPRPPVARRLPARPAAF